jgi:hypothetical protein
VAGPNLERGEFDRTDIALILTNDRVTSVMPVAKNPDGLGLPQQMFLIAVGLFDVLPVFSSGLNESFLAS